MNDTEILKWIAEHLVKFNIVIDKVDVEWIDDGGAYQSKVYRTIPMEADIEILRHVVTAITSNETIDQTRIRTGECVG